MSMFRVNVVAVNPKDDRKTTPPVEVLVDTGSEPTWLPADVLSNAGIVETRKRTFQTATKQPLTELGFDSLDTVELIMELEEEFDLNFSDEEAEQVKTVGDAIRLILKKRREMGNRD